MKKINVGIVGITGYTGEELLRIFTKHQGAQITCVMGRESSETRPLAQIYPHIKGINLSCDALDMGKLTAMCDVVFLALPHKVSMDIVPELFKAGKKIIDLSADFRIKDTAEYSKWYGVKHNAQIELQKAVYGLSELYRQDIINASFVANPGCYPTSILLALAPAIKHKLIDLDSIIIDSKSGISGAGRKTVREYMENEHPNFRAYSVAGVHRHIPEIEQELSRLASRKLQVTFTPHIMPVERGMLSTIYASVNTKISNAQIHEIYKDFYKNELFARVLDEKNLPDIKNVVATNYCDISPRIDERTNRLVVVSALDNLVKGASGQAVQNMNLMFGLIESEGLI